MTTTKPRDYGIPIAGFGTIIAFVAVIVLTTLAFTGTVPWWAPAFAFFSIPTILIVGFLVSEATKRKRKQQEAERVSAEFAEMLKGRFEPRFGEMKEDQ